MFPVALNSKQDISKLFRFSVLKMKICKDFHRSLREMEKAIQVT